jgi:hypothetical protein
MISGDWPEKGGVNYILENLNLTPLMVIWFTKTGVLEAVCGLRGANPAGVFVAIKPEECHLFLPRPMHACPRHEPWKRL